MFVERDWWGEKKAEFFENQSKEEISRVYLKCHYGVKCALLNYIRVFDVAVAFALKAIDNVLMPLNWNMSLFMGVKWLSKNTLLQSTLS